ncbi:hypothetical protein M408DRAFT_309832 [Serendipita vermifera MAFF 305830]|uniref:Uncharacterized protein n=1 Tax=Serendipita vermifera MAFF 305830 TaxID=933852 RepID=A0A0C2XXB7_SERVB|nr:hypothetical protein M408DRAFT_309832 [Serendipita vermifera MAFF 305830]
MSIKHDAQPSLPPSWTSDKPIFAAYTRQEVNLHSKEVALFEFIRREPSTPELLQLSVENSSHERMFQGTSQHSSSSEASPVKAEGAFLLKTGNSLSKSKSRLKREGAFYAVYPRPVFATVKAAATPELSTDDEGFVLVDTFMHVEDEGTR